MRERSGRPRSPWPPRLWDARSCAPRDIAAIGITNQRETTVVWDRETGKPICNAIVWQDRRTAEFCDRLKRDGHEAFIRERTGLVIDAYFSGSKVAWILDNVPGARARAEAGKLAFGTVDSWLVWQLTSGATHITDVTNASRTMLFNINTLQWDQDLLRLMNVPASMLPEVRSSSEVYGRVSTTLGAGDVAVAGIAGDQQAALFGQMCVTPGLTKNTYGTGCFLLQNTGERPVVSQNRLLSTVAWQVGGKTMYALEGSVFIGGAVVQWLRDGLGLIRQSSDVEALAKSVPDSGGVYLVPAFAGLGAPHWDPYARGTIVGITRGTTAGHIAGRPLKASRSRWPICSRRSAATPASRWPNYASMAARPPTTRCSSSRPTCSACPSCGLKSPRPPRLVPPTWRAWPSASGTRPRRWRSTGARTSASSRRCLLDRWPRGAPSGARP